MTHEELVSKYLNRRVHVIINDPYRKVDAVGFVVLVDDGGQLHGTWGGLAAIPGTDFIEVIPTNACLIRSELRLDRDMFVQSDSGRLYRIAEGVGDNLSAEDLRDGYVDYVYYSIFDDLCALYDDEESDGGMVLLRKPYLSHSVDEILDAVSGLSGDSFCRLLSEDKDDA